MTTKLLAILSCCTVTMMISIWPVRAEQAYITPVRNYVLSSIQAWSKDPTLVAAILAQNSAHEHLTAADIERLDTLWQEGYRGGDRRMIDQVLENTTSRFLRAKQASSRGIIAEVFVMDNRGLIVGESEATSDYWQGDEAKFQKSFEAGADVIFIDSVEKDDSTQMLQSQASLTISDEKGRPIGAITVGINLEGL